MIPEAMFYEPQSYAGLAATEPADQGDAGDPDAPYGRKSDGTPYKMSAEARRAAADRMTAGRQAKAAARKATGLAMAPSIQRTGGKPKPAAKETKETGPTYAMVAASLIQIPAMILGFAARWVPSLGYDSVALSVHAPALGQAAQEYAVTDQRIAQYLDKASKITPGVGLALAVLPLIAQIAVNHGYAAPNPEMGVHSPEDLLILAGILPEGGDDGGGPGPDSQG